jgi:hypothetical protein
MNKVPITLESVTTSYSSICIVGAVLRTADVAGRRCGREGGTGTRIRRVTTAATAATGGGGSTTDYLLLLMMLLALLLFLWRTVVCSGTLHLVQLQLLNPKQRYRQK